jgi:hypothetical protein
MAHQIDLELVKSQQLSNGCVFVLFRTKQAQ